MQKCPACQTDNANRNKCCRECGELIRIDPTIEKMVRKIHVEERKKTGAMLFGIVSLALGVASYFGHQEMSRMVNAGVEKATPIIESKSEATVEAKLRADLPTITTQATKELAKQVRGEMQDGLVQAARNEVEKIKP